MANPLAPTTSDSRRVPFLTDRDTAGAPGFAKGVNTETLGTHTTPSLTTLVAEQVRVSLGAFTDKRAPDTFKPFTLTAVTTEQLIWDPASGKKCRILGIHLKATVETKVNVLDGTGGSTILTIGAGAAVPVSLDLGPLGILSTAANANLYVTSSASAGIVGTVWGVEE